VSHVYIRDILANQTSLVSRDNSVAPVPGNASSSTPSISGDGKFVAFVSSSTNLVAEVVAGTVSHIYVRDILANQTSLVSRDNSVTPVPGNASSSTPSISTPIIGDRPVVAFVSLSTNLVVGVTDGTHVYVRNIQTNQTRLVSQDNSYVAAVPGVPVPGNGPSSTPAISEDGRFVAFTSQAMNLLLPTTVQTVTAGQVYVRDTDIQANQTRLVSQDNIGVSVPFPGNGLSSTPSISADGQFVAFVSSAPNLVTSPAPAAAFDVYVRAVP
jgi:Tol biopolymer transport system component